MTEKVYQIEGLDCANCAAKLERKLASLPGVEAAVLTFATGQLRITAADPDSLLPMLRETAEAMEPDVRIAARKAAHDHDHHHEHEHEHKHDHDHDHDHDHGEQERPLPALIAGAVLFALGLLVAHFDLRLGAIPAELPVLFAAYILLGWRVLVTAVKNLVRGQMLDENLLMSVATVGAFAIQEYPEAVGVMLFYRIGEYFEEKAVARSRSRIMEAVDLRPETVNRLDADTVTVIPAEEAKVGDLLLVRPGDRIPLDATVVDGESRVDTAPITGEPVPVAVCVGSSVVSGCVNTTGQLKVRVEKALSDSMVTRILNSVENAAASKPKVDRFITRFARIYTPVVVGAALALAVIPPLFGGQWRYWVYTAASFLVMSCPCALVLSVPLAFFSGIGAGSRRGILFKGGLSIEAMANVRGVVMDKTGTITQGKFALRTVNAVSGEPDALLALCAGCEAASVHPIAVSIVAAAKEQGLQLPVPTKLEELAGLGIRAQVGGETVLCGNRHLLEQENVRLPDGLAESGTTVLVAKNGKYLGCLTVADALKDDARSAVAALHSQGIHTAILTGDAQASAKAVANQVGIGEVRAKLLPADKLTQLQSLREKWGAVMFVGDGINDAPVLAGADVGAAMGSGADAAIEAADVVYMTSAMEAIPQSLAIARRTRRIAWENVTFALAIKLAVMALGVCGLANMWLAVFADTGVAMLCVLNSIRALYQKA